MEQKMKGDQSTKFIAWLACVQGFLPKQMSIEEAATIFLRKELEEGHVQAEDYEAENV